MNNTAAAATSSAFPLDAPQSAPSLKDLLEDGLYMLFMLRNGQQTEPYSQFSAHVDRFLDGFDRACLNFNKPSQSVKTAKYAFCALLDEIVLSHQDTLREEWERNPMQLRLFDEHLAGEGFFDRLENLRLDVLRNREVLEVYHACLLLGFQGKYLLEGPEKLQFLIGRIGQELANAKGGKAEFSPHWKPLQRITTFVRHEFPLWAFFALLAVLAILLFLGLNHLLTQQLA